MNNTSTIIIWRASRGAEYVFKVDPTIRNIISNNQNIKSPTSLDISIDTIYFMEFYYGVNILKSQILILLLNHSFEEIFEMFEYTKIEFRNSANNDLIYSFINDDQD